jgi:hypothetical protein
LDRWYSALAYVPQALLALDYWTVCWASKAADVTALAVTLAALLILAADVKSPTHRVVANRLQLAAMAAALVLPVVLNQLAATAAALVLAAELNPLVHLAAELKRLAANHVANLCSNCCAQ